jgi:hypothetical protein
LDDTRRVARSSKKKIFSTKLAAQATRNCKTVNIMVICGFGIEQNGNNERIEKGRLKK